MKFEVRAERPGFRVSLDPDQPWFRIDLATFSQPLLPMVSADTLAEFDRGPAPAWIGVERGDSCERWLWSAKSNLWRKNHVLEIHADHMEFYGQLLGNGADIETIRFFDLIDDTGFREHFAPTKHFNDHGRTTSRTYTTGSPIAFERVFSAEPTSYGDPFFPPFEDGLISVTGDSDYRGGNFVATPGILCYAVAAESGQEWLAFGLAPEPGEYLFSDYRYLGGSRFSFALTSWGARRIRDGLRTPRIVMTVARNAHQAVAKYVAILRASDRVPTIRRDQPDWWTRPLVCGWGHQCYQGDLFRIRSGRERPPDNAVYTLSTQTNYRDIVDMLDTRELPWGTLVIDARWFLSGGLKDIDIGRWPDLRGFVNALHARDRRVLLWWGPWDPEGILESQCIRHIPSEAYPRDNSPGPVKFLPIRPGAKINVDVTLPEVRDRIRRQIRSVLGPDGLDIDGLKIDHIYFTASLYGMAFPEGSGRLFGIEAAKEHLRLIHETAKDVRPDALLIGQSPNPYFSDVQDMVRLSPLGVYSDTIAEPARFSAAMARAADPGWLIDTNAYPMPSRAAFREYAELQPELGVPSLYYITHLDTTGEALTADDDALIRRAWGDIRK